MAKSRKPKDDEKEIFQGVYMNFNFVSVVTSYLGNLVKIHTTSGLRFRGILTSFSPKFQVALELVDEDTTPSVIEKMVFAPDDIVSLEIIDVPTECFSNENDIILKKRNTCKENEKELEPWDYADESNNLYNLDFTGLRGWDPQQMFEQNEKLFGVVSNFTEDLYTTPLQCRESSDTTNNLGIVPDSHEFCSSILSPQLDSKSKLKIQKFHSSSKPVSKSTKETNALIRSDLSILETCNQTQPSQSLRNISRHPTIPKNSTLSFQRRGLSVSASNVLMSTFALRDTSTTNYAMRDSYNFNCQGCIFNICVPKTTNYHVSSISVNCVPVYKSQLNPNAREFTPSWSRPAIIPAFPVRYTLPYHPPLYTHSPIIAAPFQPHLPYPTTRLYVWKQVTTNFRQ